MEVDPLNLNDGDISLDYESGSGTNSQDVNDTSGSDGDGISSKQWLRVQNIHI